MKKKALKAQINLMVEDLHAKDKVIEGLEAEVKRLELVIDSRRNVEHKTIEDVVMVVLNSEDLSILEKVHVYCAINRSKEFYIGGLRRMYAWVAANKKAVTMAFDLHNMREHKEKNHGQVGN